MSPGATRQVSSRKTLKERTYGAFTLRGRDRTNKMGPVPNDIGSGISLILSLSTV